MDKNKVLEMLKDKVTTGELLIDEPMKKHTTFKIGGPADILIVPKKISEIKAVVECCNAEAIPFMVVGNGSNLLVRDGGIRGVVIKLAENFSGVEVVRERLKIQAGALMSKVANIALENSLGGFEFGSGIPGTIGGAVTMNAGAYGGEIGNLVASVTCLDLNGNIKTYTRAEMEFGYRKSLVQAEKLTVLEAELEFASGNYDEIKAKIAELTAQRTSKQPLQFASAGSTFKRPEGYFAGKLIEDSGLRGFRHRNVQIAEKHCGFVINLGDSTAEDVLHLIATVQKIVYDNFGIRLETEIRIIGEDK